MSSPDESSTNTSMIVLSFGKYLLGPNHDVDERRDWWREILADLVPLTCDPRAGLVVELVAAGGKCAAFSGGRSG
ncbi:hypothetical protein PtB15_12B349 [Puccinia triticina]|nr:hypothetical protein PtB15_12B349 [Puccinia triticina]